MGSGSKTTTTNQNEQATTVPQIPGYASDPAKNYFSGINNYQQSDPYQFVAPINGLQTQAFQNANGLFQTGPIYQQAANIAGNVASAQAPQAATQTAQMGTLGAPAQAQAQGYTAPTLGPASQVTAANAGQAQTVNLNGYTPGQIGQAQGYTAQQAGPVNLNPQANQAQAQSLLSNLSAYQNPYTQQVVDSTLADYDRQAELQRGQYVADAARNKGFGGSGHYLGQAALDADLSRGRAAMAANLRSGAFNTAAGLSGMDADRRQNVSLFNAGAQNQRDEYGAGLNAQTSMFNTGQQNQAAQFGANANNLFKATQFDADNIAKQFTANAQNQGSLFNADQQNQFALTNSGYQQQANLANQAANNQFGLAQFGADTDAAQFGANAQNVANLANMQAANTYGLANFDAQNQLNQFNASQGNDMNRFNAGLQQQGLSQQMQAAGLLGDLASGYGSNYRADLDTQLGLGNSLYGLQSNYLNAPLTQLQNIGNLLNPGYIDAVSGKTVTGSSSGVSKEKSSGGLFNTLLGVASVASPFF